MLSKPKFKPCFHIEDVESVGVFLLSESEYFVLNGHLYEQLAPLIDGEHSVEEIINLLQGQASTAEIYYALMLMEKKGYIVENDNPMPSDMPSEVAAFWNFLNVDHTTATSRLQSTKVSVRSFGTVPTQPLIAILESLNIQVAEEGEITVVLTDDYLQVGLDRFNHKALQSQGSWMLVKPVGKMIWIGPIFDPGKTGCWECLAQRLRANRPVEDFLRKHRQPNSISTAFPTSRSLLPSTLDTGLNLAATEIAKWIVQGDHPSLKGTLVTFDTISLETKNHTLVKRPQCPACGDSGYLGDRDPLPVLLESRKKTFTADGGHRCVSPEKTFKQYEHHISPIIGAIRGITKVSKLNSDLTPNYVAGHNFASMLDSLYFLRKYLRGRSAGKGKTDAQAKASALGEAIERYSGVFQGDEIRRKGSYKTMADVAIHPNACMLFSDRQYQTRQDWNQSCSSFFQKVPEPFDPEREIEWTPIWSLTDKAFKYLPTAYCYYGYPKPSKPDCWADSNGTAAGNTKEEAILQGFMELVERDSVALWWYNRLKRPAVDLYSFNQPYFIALKEYYQSLNRELWVLDLTSDLSIPAFAALSRRIDQAVEDIIFAFGAHFDPKIGIMRSLTELNQVLPAVVSIAPDGSTKYNYSDQLAIDWWRMATLQNQPYLVPDENTTPKLYTDYPQLSSDDLRDDVQTCVDIAAKQGMETLVLDQTRPDIGLNVVKVIVPGLRHFWKRWAPGRLYDVPVQMGQLPKSLNENQLNPFPIFF
ncbi:TOMM precursor leader peptide-binding protein [Moorena producens]|uniref:TOMM precursor leader peptide-binding protein n=1 Tax=Moorena producens TaxID=1155739 RepID=UPI003C7898F8